MDPDDKETKVEIIISSKAELLKTLRNTLKVPVPYEAYIDIADGTWDMVTQNQIHDVVYAELEYTEKNIEVFETFGMFKGDYFILVHQHLTPAGTEPETILFTNDYKRWHREFLYKKIPKRRIKRYETGFYKPAKSMYGWYLYPVRLAKDIAPVLNHDLFNVLRKEVLAFKQKRNVYKEMKMDYKRGILLTGEAGNGKTSFIKHLLNELKEEAICILCDMQSSSELEFISDIVSDKHYENVLKILVMEDIDGTTQTMRSTLLNFLDGAVPVDNTIFIATTNYPERLDAALKNRPSRFDSLHYIGNPNNKSRRKLLKIYFPKLRADEMTKAVQASKGFSGAYFKEIYILGKLNDLTPINSIIELKKRFAFFDKH